MTITRDTKFKLAFDNFIKDVIGITDYDLENLTKNKSESRHIYRFSIPEQTTVIGFIDRNGDTHTWNDIEDTHTWNDIANMNISSDDEVLKTEYIPEKELIIRQFMETFDPYIDAETLPCTIPGQPHYKHAKSFVRLDNCEVNDESGVLEGKICVVYHKTHIPYYVENDDGIYEKKYSLLLCRFNNVRTKLNNAYNDIDEIQDDLLYNERQLRKAKRVLYRETNNHTLSENNLINKLHAAYIKSDIKEECPVCYDTIENEKLIIPRCAHYICDSCHPRCDECPICRMSYTPMGV
ncbi:hypothetical protein OAS95_04560 [Pelagibacteraceae bacterium]|nr:hypothetical protein [Pelagibacteraceae bacterium]